MGKGENDCATVCAVACGVACLSCCYLVFVLGLMAHGIANFVIGSTYLHDCSLEKMVPIYLIVNTWAPYFGWFGKNEEAESGLTASTICGFIGFLFNIAWLICGSIWIYPTYSTVNKDTYVPCAHVNGTYTPEVCTMDTCNDTLLKFSFAMVTINWIVMAIRIYVVGCNIVRICKRSKLQNTDSKTTAGIP